MNAEPWAKGRINTSESGKATQEARHPKLCALPTFDRPLIVRSSSAHEDTEESSMAGRFTSVLDVRGWDAFTAAVGRVLDSAHAVGPPPGPDFGRPLHGMAVLVQPMLEAAAGGGCSARTRWRAATTTSWSAPSPATRPGWWTAASRACATSSAGTAACCAPTRTHRAAPARSTAARRPGWPGSPAEPRRFRRIAKILLLCLIGYGLLWACSTGGMLAVSYLARQHTGSSGARTAAGINHFVRVDGKVWRGSAPGADGYRELADKGVRTVVDLRAEKLPAKDLAEPLQAGLKSVRLPIRDGQTPTPQQVDAFLRVVRQSPGPVFVHCGAGVGRTGTMTAAYLVRTGGADSHQAACAPARSARPAWSRSTTCCTSTSTTTSSRRPWSVTSAGSWTRRGGSPRTCDGPAVAVPSAAVRRHGATAVPSAVPVVRASGDRRARTWQAWGAAFGGHPVPAARGARRNGETTATGRPGRSGRAHRAAAGPPSGDTRSGASRCSAGGAWRMFPVTGAAAS